MADGAGKRTTRLPDRYGESLMGLSELDASSVTMVRQEPPRTTSQQTVNTSTSEDMESQGDLRDMMRQLLRKMDVSTTQIELKIDQTNRRVEEYRTETRNHINQCLERWQVSDTRLQKVEDANINLIEEVKLHETKINDVTGKVAKVEKMLTYQVEQLTDRIRIVEGQPIPSDDMSHGAPLPSSTILPPAVSTYQSLGASFFSSPERLTDAVSEFTGQPQTIHPCKFLRQLDTYFENVPLSPTQQLMSAQHRLTGNALIWYESLIPTPKSYAEFRIIFNQYFWSSTAQRKARNDIFRPFRYDKSYGLANHAMQWISKAKYLSPPVEQDDLISIIIQHYPTPLGMAIRGRGPQTTNELLSVLAEFEETTSFCEPRFNHNPQNGQSRTSGPNNHGMDNPRTQNPRRFNNSRFPPRPDNRPQPVQQISEMDVSGNE